MVKNLFLHREGTVSVTQMPHEGGGFTHILATPTKQGVLYYVAHRENRRTKKMKVISGGYRSEGKAFQKLYAHLKKINWNSHAPWDPMAAKVEKWERQYVDPHFQHERLTKDQMLALLYRVCGDRKVEPPRVIFIKGASFCYHKRCEKSQSYVVMSEGHGSADLSNSAFILHEMAHYLSELTSPNIDNHGALFMREYLGLLRDFTNLNMDELIDGCRKHKVKYWLPT